MHLKKYCAHFISNHTRERKSNFLQCIQRSPLDWLLIFPAERVFSQISSLKYLHVRIIKFFTWPNLSSPPSFRSSLVSSLTVIFCYFAENSTSKNLATSFFSISSSKNNVLCNKEDILLLKESEIMKFYEFLQFLLKKSIEPSQM